MRSAVLLLAVLATLSDTTLTRKPGKTAIQSTSDARSSVGCSLCVCLSLLWLCVRLCVVLSCCHCVVVCFSVVASQAVKYTKYQSTDQNCSGNIVGDVLTLGNNVCEVKETTDSRRAVCGDADGLVTFRAWAGSTTCPAGGEMSYAFRNATQANSLCVPV